MLKKRKTWGREKKKKRKTCIQHAEQLRMTVPMFLKNLMQNSFFKESPGLERWLSS